MSKVGKKPIVLAEWVTIDLWDDVVVSGPKWSISIPSYAWITVSMSDDGVVCSIDDDQHVAMWWTMRALINNAVVWVTEWYTKQLQILWVWYWFKLSNNILECSVWFSHKVNYPIPEWIEATIIQDAKGNDILTIAGIDKQLVWQTSAEIRNIKKPEPYKWKWIRFVWEVVKLKAGKAAA